MKFFKLICFIGLVFLLSVLSADEGPKIMVINSNAAVDKYKIAQEEFTKTISTPVVEIDLGGRKWKIGEIEDLLYDEYPDLVYCIGTKAYLLANKFISDRNIVFSSVINWHRLPLSQKTYGVSSELNPEMQITLYRYIFPGLKRIGVLYSSKYNKHWFNEAQKAAKEMGIEIIGRSLSKRRNTLPELKGLLKEIDALWLISDPVVMSDKKTLIEVFKQCDISKIPILSYHNAFAEYGAMVIVSVDNPTTGRQAAAISREVLSKDVVRKKVQLPAGSHIFFNLKKADEYGLKYREMALSAVNRIIE
ncbi:MAG: ABC transporter substrate-binding protein [Deltaproteobacteria bacterium]|uniref:ABC transporter substrate-binding protein n=1 Tax=Candidatus Desulfacyla euxinica TaxID=2841693 RepID=A0A8J6N1U0_9DELT|nr:ABC transporter substrate-binding protein [Candidatus Desulfacyla euxinica]MBL7216089.1 ABC transporter substrate-binding protein [Desulfobacteraceae bacterium]